MKFARNLAAIVLTMAALTGCDDNSSSETEATSSVRFATYNLSFDRDSYDILVNQMELTPGEQDKLVEEYEQDSEGVTLKNKDTAEKVIQIRNVAEVIQRTNPDVFVLAEFNNDGTGEDTRALEGFQKNYLSVAQDESLEGIQYQYQKSFATNTGLESGYDLNLDDSVGGPDDAWGFGAYHGQYAFAVFSKYPFDENNIRTFQNFKWKDMPEEENIKIDDCEATLPEGKECGDSWYPSLAWAQFPLSSKNHIDLPVRVASASGEEVIHFLVSHPAPPIFDNPAGHNTKRNRAEVDFWVDYIDAQNYIYDDNGVYGGLEQGAHFVIAGDLNADPRVGDGDLTAIQDLLNHSLVNNEATLGVKAPTSKGGPEYYETAESDTITPAPENITSTSALMLDHVIPSADLAVKASGVFWPASFEEGYHLVYDEKLGASKGVSSDHRLVWVDVILGQ